MPAVTLHAISEHNLQECLSLKPGPDQSHLVATVQKSLQQAKELGNRYPLAVYDVKSRGMERATEPVLGFVMYEIVAGVGFIERLLIDKAWQGKGYGKSTMQEVIRRLKLYPEVELIATSHRRQNTVMAGLLNVLGFVMWDVPFENEDTDEIFMRLKVSQAAE